MRRSPAPPRGGSRRQPSRAAISRLRPAVWGWRWWTCACRSPPMAAPAPRWWTLVLQDLLREAVPADRGATPRCCWSNPTAPAGAHRCDGRRLRGRPAGRHLGLHRAAAAGQPGRAPPLIPNLSAALVVMLSVALSGVLVVLLRCAPAHRRRAGAGRGAGLPQGDGGLAGDRPAPGSSDGLHACQRRLLPDGRLQRRGARRDGAALLAAGNGRDLHPPPGRSVATPATRPRARATRRCSCAAAASASRC